MLTGSGRVLLCIRTDFVDEVSPGELEDAYARIDADLRAAFVELVRSSFSRCRGETKISAIGCGRATVAFSPISSGPARAGTTALTAVGCGY